MVDIMSRLSDGHATATALVERDERISYGELSDRVVRTAAALRQARLRAGAPVAVEAGSSVDGVVGYLGVQAAGLLPVMVNPRSPRSEQQRRFDEVDPAVVVLGSATTPEVPEGVRVVRPAGSAATDAEVLTAEPAGSTRALGRVGADDPAVVLYTSGMSGIPKPIVLTFGNLQATSDGLIT